METKSDLREICQCGKPLMPREHVMEEDDWNCRNRKPEPVADGGGLPPRPRKAKSECFSTGSNVYEKDEMDEYINALLAAHAASQEALRLARERMQQAATILDNLFGGGCGCSQCKAVRPAISLLSPEGSTKSENTNP